MIASLLEPHFHRIYTAASGEEALRIYRQKDPDIILSDIYMPGITGLELAQTIRKENREIPILLLSAHNDTETLLQAANLTIDGFVIKPILEIDHLLQRLREAVERIASGRGSSTDGESIDTLRSKAYLDALTGVANAHSFQEKLKELTEQPVTPFSLLYIDLDNLKAVNDRYGHSAGDRLLQSFAQQIRTAGEEHFFARVGGDEFVMIIEDIVEKEPIRQLVETLLRSVENGTAYRESTLPISCSIGICRYPIDAPDPTELVDRADRAMYRAKRQGKNTYTFCS